MDSSTDVVLAERERFQQFKLGKKPGHAHARSHSRNGSISSLKSLTTVHDLSHVSLPLPLSNLNGAAKPPRPLSSPSIANFQNSAIFPPASIAAANSTSLGKRNSHHRRRSSVSTRHESAELMGMSVPSLPPAAPEDNINLGEKDSIRRRALWALEGKPDVAFNKVEIPDFSTTDMEKMMSLTPSSSPIYNNGLNMNSKRDSFKLLAGSSSSKDQLQTLVEEEEEEEEDQSLQTKVEDSLPSPATSIKENIPPSTLSTPTPAVAVTEPFRKPRPATLNLRPLSLTPENLITAPSNCPSRSGLRALSLTPSSGGSDNTTATESLRQFRRNSQIVTPTPALKRPVLKIAPGQVVDSPDDAEDGKVDRRSSISYKRSSNTGLPTPEMTPTFGRRFPISGSSLSSISSGTGMPEEDAIFAPPTQTPSRPLSASEQHFLFKSHHALLARITDLEKALSVRMRESLCGFSRPISISSTLSGMSDSESPGITSPTEGPSDEMLRLIADLKAERDELKRDVDGWRQRVNKLEKQTDVLAKRLESERREAWVARSKAGLLDAEKGILSRKLVAVDELAKFHEKEKEIWEKEKTTLETELQGYKQRVGDLENELKAVKDLDCEKVKVHHDPLATPKPNNMSFENAFVRPTVIISPPPEPVRRPKKHGLGFMSVDSESSTDVELDDSSFETKSGFGLKAVEEELDEALDTEEELDEALDDEDGLAGYEDEDDEDDMSHDSSTSFDSEEFSTQMQRQLVGLPPSPNTPTFGIYKALPPAPVSQHFPQSSLSINWTFPTGPATTTSVVQEDRQEGVDRFFDCLDDNDSEGGESTPSSFSYEKSKGLFARGFALAPEGDDAAFFLPAGVGVTVPGEPVKQRTQLAVVTEEEEDDGSMFGDISGIKIIFTPPQEEDNYEREEEIQVSPPKPKRASPPPILPALNFGDDDDDDPFNFGRPLPSSAEKSGFISSSLPPVPVAIVSPPVISVSSPPLVAVSPSSSRSMSSSSRSNSRPPSPSMIPRVVSPPMFSRTTPPGPATPTRRPLSTRTSASPTLSSKPLPSFIPQPPRSLPSPRPKPRTAPTSTFIRQPSAMKNSLPAKSVKAETAGSSPNGSTVPAIVLPLDERMNVTSLNRSTTSECRTFTSFFNSFVHSDHPADVSKMNTIPDNQQRTRLQTSTFEPNDSQSTPPVMPPSPSTTRLSFHTLTNLVPWPSRNRPLTAARSPLPPSPTSPNLATVSPNERGFVSRERQLDRLRSSMQMEDGVRVNFCVQCKKCSGKVVVV